MSRHDAAEVGRAEDQVRPARDPGREIARPRTASGGVVRAVAVVGRRGEPGIATEGLQEEVRVVEPDGVDDVREGAPGGRRGSRGGGGGRHGCVARQLFFTESGAEQRSNGAKLEKSALAQG